MAAVAVPELRRCEHQVGGHMTKDQKPDTLVDAAGRFYKPYQAGDRNQREAAFYHLVWGPSGAGGPESGTPGFGALDAPHWGQGPAFEAKPGTVHSPADLEKLRDFIPKSYGITTVDGRNYLIMEDVVGAHYKKPSVMDLKMGFVTGYPWASVEYRDKCRGKDETSTQGSLGFRISGMQVYDPATGETAKSDRQYGKTLTDATVSTAFTNFAGPLGSAVLYQGAGAILDQVKAIREWFGTQTSFCFYQASLLFAYEGGATDLGTANVQVRLIDFAHTFPTNGEKDVNFIGGLDSLIRLLEGLK